MKKQFNPGVLIISLAVSVLLSGCSQNNKAASDEKSEMGESAEMKAAPAEIMEAVKPFENVDPVVRVQINGFLSDYLELNKTLIEDNNDQAKVAAKKLSQTVNGFDMSKLTGEQMGFYHQQLEKLNAGLKAMSEGADIEETRTELAPVSESMYALVKAYQSNSIDLYYQYCPMARNGEGANWLSATEELVNPYMGQRMLKCGRTQEIITMVK